MRRLFRHVGCGRCLGAIRLDHDQARVVEQLLRVDPRRFGHRLGARFLLLAKERRRLGAHHFLLARLFAGLRFDGLVLLLLRAALQLMDAALLLDHGRITDLLVLARPVAAFATLATTTAATAAAAAPVLFAFTLRRARLLRVG